MSRLPKISIILLVCFLSAALCQPPTLGVVGQDGAATTANNNNNNNNKVDNQFQHLFPSTTLDLPAMQSLFHVNQNSIIRTHDSRSMGATFINSTLLNTNDECMRFCWNTFNCNLAVFEGKEKGTCYIFDCGSLDNFKCRFTPHEFYTSAVLHVNRNPYLLQEWKSESNRENELTDLREKHPAAVAATPPPALSMAHPEENINKEQQTVAPTQASKCRHYQFECRNNSECIAIYNVCDGIPQCSDGSDEAVELECHKSRLNSATKSAAAAVVASATVVNNNKAPESGKIDLTPFNHQSKPMTPYGDASGTRTSEDWPGLKLSSSNYYTYPHSANEEGGTLYPKGVVPNPQTGVDYGNYPPANWNPFNGGASEVGNNKPSEKMTSSFEQSLSDRFNKEAPPPPPPVYWPPMAFASGEQQPKPGQMPPRPMMNRPYEGGYSNPSLNYENRAMPDYSSLAKPIPGAVFPSDSMPPSVVTNNNNNNNNSTGSKKTEYSHSGRSKMVVGEGNVMAMSVLHDVANQNGRETNSAVIALTLGLFITLILVFLVGCRMKAFEKRLARRGRSLAHDSDYLVNGMHL